MIKIVDDVINWEDKEDAISVTMWNDKWEQNTGI